MANIGDARRLTIDGSDYRVTGGSDLPRKLGNFQKTSVPTSGSPDVKFEKQNQDIEGAEVQAMGEERLNLQDISNLVDPVPIAYVDPSGSVGTCEGHITITASSTQDGKLTLTLIPTNEWVDITV